MWRQWWLRWKVRRFSKLNNLNNSQWEVTTRILVQMTELVDPVLLRNRDELDLFKVDVLSHFENADGLISYLGQVVKSIAQDSELKYPPVTLIPGEPVLHRASEFWRHSSGEVYNPETFFERWRLMVREFHLVWTSYEIDNRYGTFYYRQRMKELLYSMFYLTEALFQIALLAYVAESNSKVELP